MDRPLISNFVMKFLLNTTLIVITIFACFVENIYLALRPPEPGKTAALTIRARQPFTFDQKIALSSRRIQALSQFVPVFNYVPERVNASKKKIQLLTNELLAYQARKKDRVDELVLMINTEFGVDVSANTMSKVLQYRDLRKLLKGILTVAESILQNKILDDPKNLEGKNAIEIHDPALASPAVTAVDELTSLQTARLTLLQKVQEVFWQVDESILNPVLKISQTTLLPNLIYDQKENDQRLDKIHRQYPTEALTFQAGDILVPFRKVISEEDILLLKAYQQQQIKKIYRNAPWVVFTILFMIIFYNLFLSKVMISGSRKAPPQRPLISLLILCVVVLKGCLLFTPLPIYFIPFAFLPLMVISLNHGKLTATGTAMVGAIWVSLFAGPQYTIVLYLIFGGLAATLVSANIQKRWQIILPSVIVGLINALSVMALSLDWQAVFPPTSNQLNISALLQAESFNAVLMERIGWAFAGGLAAGPLALLLLPLLEISWDTASTFKLNRYSDLQHPLLKKLQQNAPGTYQHSMTLAHLAQVVGEAIGANSLLLRIGAYYHDIGKMEAPKNFIENQFNSPNPHDLLDPWESTELIISHVKSGIKIAMAAGLPRAVVDLIIQHHGTQLMEYFFNLATKEQPRETLDELDFRYPGPKPQTAEAAILMIVDSVEAASRTMQDPTRLKLDKMVQLMVGKRIADGQFSQCDLTTRDISKIVRALVDALEVSFHSRIRYPWQEKVSAQRRSSWNFRIGGKDKPPPSRRSFKM
ncbi:MAG: HDIG domain-containing protein [Deltaproteobacteria bacterium]|jgi:putative nucleotidyltransferase with HDIG domain|nr:HDIG domain-containing protein [Deltaproteobacteria bacterium]